MSSVAPTAPAVSTTPGYHPTLLLVGRILLAAIFLIAGSRKVMTYAATVGYFTKLGFPMPEVMAETIPGFELVTWHGVMMSPATPPVVLERVNRELNAVLQRADVRERFANSGLQITGGPPQEFAAILRRDYDKYGAALRSAGVKPE